MNLKRLRKRCEERLRELGLSGPLDAQSLCDALAAQRGRPIRLRPVTNYAGPCGLWIATDSTDYIFYESNTSLLHQEHIVLHEASHILCGHRSASVLDGNFRASLFPDLKPELVLQVLHRAAYTESEEREAEVMASLISERRTGTGLADQPPLGDEAHQVIDRLVAYLQERT
jgi:hypothetical protein